MAGQEGVGTLLAKTLQTSYVENKGNGRFQIRPLPVQMQLAPVYGLLVADVNVDGNQDFVAVGNSYAPEVAIGRYDAFKGEVMLGNGKGSFHRLNFSNSGFIVDGDAKGLVLAHLGGARTLIATQNNDSVSVFRISDRSGIRCVNPARNEMVALLKHRDGRTTRIELAYGSGYLSQPSRQIVVSADVEAIEWFDGQGSKTRTSEF